MTRIYKCFDNMPMLTEHTPKRNTVVSTIFDYCKNSTQNAPKRAIFHSEVKIIFWEGGRDVGRGISRECKPRGYFSNPGLRVWRASNPGTRVWCLHVW